MKMQVLLQLINQPIRFIKETFYHSLYSRIILHHFRNFLQVFYTSGTITINIEIKNVILT